MPQWLLELKGEPEDINLLKPRLPSGFGIEELDGCLCLVCDHFAEDEYANAEGEAHKALERANFLTALRQPSYRSVVAGGFRRIARDGRVTVFLHIGAAEWGLRMGGPSNTEWQSSDEQLLHLAETDDLVAEVQKYWMASERQWFLRCWDVYERIRDDLNDPAGGVSGRARITDWMGEDPEERFSGSVQLHRHAAFRVLGRKPLPLNPMRETEACEFIRRLLRKWLDHKLANR